MERLCYAGIGSRKTPQEVLLLMTRMAVALRERGFVLRSGGAEGADRAFEAGAGNQKEIFLPWRNAFGHSSPLAPPSQEAMEMAEGVHPGWQWLKPGARKLMARNCHQILGEELNDPVRFVIAWTPDGCESHHTRSRVTGGTGQAIALASLKDIPVFNLANADAQERLKHFVREIVK